MALKNSQTDETAEVLLVVTALKGDDDLATRAITPAAEDLRGYSTNDDFHSIAIVSNLKSPTVIERKMPDKRETSSLA